MPFVLEFSQSDREFLSEEFLGMLGAVTEHVVHAEDLRLVVKNHAGVRRDGHFAGCECVERIYRLVRRYIVRKVDYDVDLVCCKVVDLLDLDLSCLLRLEDGLDHYRSGLAVRHLRDGEGVLVDLLDLSADLDLASLALAAVLRTVCRTSCKEVREYLEILALKDCYRCIYEFVEVMRQDLRCETCSDTFSTLSQEDRELHRKFDRLLVSSVVRSHPVGGLRVEHHFLSELAQTSLDVSRSRIRVACEDVTPVTLAVHEIVSLSEPYEGSEDGLVAMRMELHRLSDDVGHLGVASVVHSPHGMKHTPLNRLETVDQMRHRSVEYSV